MGQDFTIEGTAQRLRELAEVTTGRLYSQVELNHFLDKMAHQAVETLIPHQPLLDDIHAEPYRCSLTICEWKPIGEEPWVEWREHVRDVIKEKLQQLKEDVQRG